jgi:uncharacterized coiled-coil protein SlyX
MVDPEEATRLEARLSQLEALVAVDHAHTENLIERVYELETRVDAINARLRAVERATPLQAPPKPPAPRGPAPKRPTR